MSGVGCSGAHDLVLAHSTVRSASFEQRVEAAARAGFAGIGLAARGYAHLRATGRSDADLRAVLGAHDIRLTETEGLLGFSSTGEVAQGVLRGRRYADPEVEAQVFAMADAFGVRHVNVGGALEGQLERDAADAFAALCDRAAEHDLLVALEPLPCSTVPDLRTAARIVEEAGRPNGGLCLDSWHFFRGSDDEDSLRALPGDRVFVLQLDDGPMLPRSTDYLLDTMHNRQLPGAGEFDLARFVALVDGTGARAPVSVEVLSDELDRRRNPQEAAELAAAATRRLLDRVRAAPPHG
jgi:sugar phosphate isomerase/epimerase